MILDCPGCHARFLVADAQIPPAGRTVKCGKCAHHWHVQHPADSLFGDMLEAELHQPEPTAPYKPRLLPALRPLNIPVLPFKIAAPALALAWAIIALYAYFPAWQYGPLSGLYGALGATDTRDLVFSEVTMEREELEGKTKFWINGSFANESAEARLLPKLRVQLKDSEGDVLWQRVYDVNYEMKAGEIYPFALSDVETGLAKSATSMVLDVGNNFELVMR